MDEIRSDRSYLGTVVFVGPVEFRGSVELFDVLDAGQIGSGLLAHEYGGLEADVSAYAGLVKIEAGVTSQVTLSAFAEGLLDDADAATARTTLGLAIGADVQAYDADLAAIAALTGTGILERTGDATWQLSAAASSDWSSLTGIPAAIDALDGLTPAADALPYFTGATTADVTTLTPFARSLLDDADAATARSTLGVAIGTDVQAYDATLAAIAALTIAADSLTVGTGADAFSQVSFAANTFPAKASVGSLEAKPISDFGLSLIDDTDAGTARATLGLGTAATANSGDFDPSGTAATAVSNHEAALDPHPQYLDSTEAAAAYQPLDATLTALAGVTTAADQLIYATAADTFAAASLTSFARTLLDDADAATARATLGAVGTADANSWSQQQTFNGGAIFTTDPVSFQSTLLVSGELWLGNEQTPAQITANQNNYAIADDASVFRLSSDAARTITGIAGGSAGRVIVLLNVGSQAITLAHASGSSTAGNQFFIPGGSSLTLIAGEAAALWYDDTAAIWKVIAVARNLVSLSTGVTGTLPVANGGTGATTAADARTNLGLAAIAASGSWSDLAGTPTTLAGYGITDAQPLDATLTALAAYNTNGIVCQTAADTFAGRTLTGTANQITVTNGDGVGGNPTISLPQDIHTAATPQFSGLGIGTAGVADEINLVGGQGKFLISSSSADATQKNARFGTRHYTASEEPVYALVVSNSSSHNDLVFGGSSATGNAATRIGFFAAANNTTTTGTRVCQFDGPGGFNVLVGSALGSPSGATQNLVFAGGSTSPTLGAATADKVSLAGVDNGAGNRELQIQPESGGYLAWGNNNLRRVPASTRDVEQSLAHVTTTDATATTLATIPITSGYTYLIDAVVVARRTGGTAGTAEDGASYQRRATYTTKAGTVTLMGSVETLGTDAEDQAGWDATLTISGTNVLLRVQGAANNNVSWFADITVRRIAS